MKIIDPYVCKDCGSEDVDQEGWVNINTLKYNGDSVDEPYYYCNNCNNSTDIISLKQYKALKKLRKNE